jgi:hypothetical protein
MPTGTVRLHRVQEERRAVAAAAAVARLTAGGTEHDPAVGQFARLQVARRAERQLPQTGAVDVDLVEVEVPFLRAFFVDGQPGRVRHLV